MGILFNRNKKVAPTSDIQGVRTYGEYKAYLNKLASENDKAKAPKPTAPTTKTAAIRIEDVKTYGDYKAYLQALDGERKQQQTPRRGPSKTPTRVKHRIQPPVLFA